MNDQPGADAPPPSPYAPPGPPPYAPPPQGVAPPLPPAPYGSPPGPLLPPGAYPVPPPGRYAGPAGGQYFYLPPDYPPQAWAPVALVPRMPGAVRALTIVTYVSSGIAIGMILLFALLAAFIGTVFFGLFGDGEGATGLVAFFVAGTVASLGLASFACFLAWQTGQRKSWARWALAVCSVAMATVSVLALSPATIVTLAGSIAVLVLLFVPDTNEWFRTAPEISGAPGPPVAHPEPEAGSSDEG